MREETKQIMIVVLGLLAITIAITVPVAYYKTETLKAAMENGYEEVALPGMAGTYWGKKETNE